MRGTALTLGRHSVLSLTFAAGLLGLPLRAKGQAAADTTIKMETLGDGIYLFRAPYAIEQWTATNVVVIVNDLDVTVFDSNTRPSTARRVIAEIRRLTTKPVRTLINSHWHMDHWSGNDEYVKAFPGVQIVATTETRDFMKRMGTPFFLHGLNAGLARSRASLDTAIKTGKRSDGTPLTAEARRQQEAEIEETSRFARDVAATPRVLPNVAFRDTLILWSGQREFRLISETGDAKGSTVLYLPKERLLITGDVLVSPEEGDGPPPWTTNSFAITPWLNSLRSLLALDVATIVPGQGPAQHDKRYLALTVELYDSVIAQVHSALERGLTTTDAVRAAVDVDAIGRRFSPAATTIPQDFRNLVGSLIRKVVQESLDGVVR